MKLLCSFVFWVIDGAADRWCQSPSFRLYRREYTTPYVHVSLSLIQLFVQQYYVVQTLREFVLNVRHVC